MEVEVRRRDRSREKTGNKLALGDQAVAETGSRVADGERSPPFSYFRRLTVNAAWLAIGDSLALCLAVCLAGLVRSWWSGEAMMTLWWAAVVMAWVVGSIFVGLLPAWGLGSVEELRRTVLLWMALFGLTTMSLFLFNAGADASRFTVTMAFFFSAPLLLASRVLVKKCLVRRETWGVPAVIYGAGRTGALILQALVAERGLGFSPTGFFDDDGRLKGSQIEGVPVYGDCEESTAAAPVAILAMPGVSSRRVAELLESSLAGYQRVIIIPDLFDAPSLWVKPRDFLGILGLQISSNLSSPLARTFKRAVDITVAVLTLPLCLPFLAIAGLLIWLRDFGNPFFVQERVGRHGRRFRVWKLRTMVQNAEEVLNKRLTADPKLRSEWTERFKLMRDPRVTWIGTILRRTSLDELPQLFNVLFGEMSLVGPRPLPPYHNEELTDRVRQYADSEIRCGRV